MCRVLILIARERIDAQYVFRDRFREGCKKMNDNLLLQDCLKGKALRVGRQRQKLKEKRGHVRWTNYQTDIRLYIVEYFNYELPSFLPSLQSPKKRFFFFSNATFPCATKMPFYAPNCRYVQLKGMLQTRNMPLIKYFQWHI